MEITETVFYFLFLLVCAFPFEKDDKITKDNEEMWRRLQEDDRRRYNRITNPTETDNKNENT